MKYRASLSPFVADHTSSRNIDPNSSNFEPKINPKSLKMGPWGGLGSPWERSWRHVAGGGTPFFLHRHRTDVPKWCSRAHGSTSDDFSVFLEKKNRHARDSSENTVFRHFGVLVRGWWFVGPPWGRQGSPFGDRCFSVFLERPSLRRMSFLYSIDYLLSTSTFLKKRRTRISIRHIFKDTSGSGLGNGF